MIHKGLVTVLLATIFHLSFKTNEPCACQYLVWALSQSRPVKARQELMSQPRLDTATARVPSKEMNMREPHSVGPNITLVLTPQFCWRHCCSERTEEEGAWAPQTQHTYIFNRLNFTYCLNGSCIFNDSLSHWHGNRYPAIVVLQWGVEPFCRDFLGYSQNEANWSPSSTAWASGWCFEGTRTDWSVKDAAALRFSGHWFIMQLQF